MKNPLVPASRLIAAFALALTVALSAADPTAGLRGLTGPSFDDAFLRQMITQHHLGIRLTDAVSRQAVRDDVKQLAARLGAIQRNEIEELQALLSAGPAIAPGSSFPNAPRNAKIAVRSGTRPGVLRGTAASPLGGEAEDPDRHFVNQMFALQSENLELAQLARERSSAAEVRLLADKLVRSQSPEMQQVQQLRAELLP